MSTLREFSTFYRIARYSHGVRYSLRYAAQQTFGKPPF
jgi:hypothetical protein